MSAIGARAYHVRSAREDDNEAILSLLEDNPQPGPVSLAFERAPDYFHSAAVSCRQADVFVVEQHRPGQSAPRMSGVFNIGRRDLYVNGTIQPVRYAHDFRIAHAARGGEALWAAYEGGRAILDGQRWIQAVVLADNQHFLNAIRRRRKGMPAFYPAGDIETSLLCGWRRRPRNTDGLTIRMANRQDLAIMQSFYDRLAPRRQFAPAYRFADLIAGDPFYRGLDISDYWLAFDGDELVGLAGTWDQKAFRQTRVSGYSLPMRLARPFYNGWSRIRGGIRLPGKGDCFNYRMVHTLLARQQDPLILEAMLCHLHRCFRPYYDALVCGFFDSDPGAGVAAGFSRRVLRSHHFLVSWSGTDPTTGLDGGLIPYAEVARL
ncbi:hypothetical protein EZI54_06240 [Marinobacter halodurans]|uniref:N-acetyltransferase domain-containing protein n=1 Tax=Marinobacter halodurans TaxID=2528979 RepID=A0ABY1ZN14_9GAMM|nr:hypothetical protein [Marinobacter halodurans]TBW57636.1 hypothetical protein EZI54_06240 [Marinobacter halodurans]